MFLKPAQVAGDLCRLWSDEDSDRVDTKWVLYNDTQTFTWTLNEKLELGVSSTTTAGVNLEVLSAEEELTVSFGFEIGSTQSWTKTETREFSVEETLRIPPHKTIRAEWIIQQLKNLTLPFTVVYELSGKVSLALAVLGFGIYRWTGSVGELLTAAMNGGTKNWTVNGDIARLSFSGQLVADQGVITKVILNQKDIEKNKAQLSTNI